jgi:hypothetical protein
VGEEEARANVCFRSWIIFSQSPCSWNSRVDRFRSTGDEGQRVMRGEQVQTCKEGDEVGDAPVLCQVESLREKSFEESRSFHRF